MIGHAFILALCLIFDQLLPSHLDSKTVRSFHRRPDIIINGLYSYEKWCSEFAIKGINLDIKFIIKALSKPIFSLNKFTEMRAGKK